MVTDDDSIVVIGGEGFLNRGYVYEDDNWSPLPDLPMLDINSHACGFFNNGILVTGGASSEADSLLKNYFLDWTLRDQVFNQQLLQLIG